MKLQSKHNIYTYTSQPQTEIYYSEFEANSFRVLSFRENEVIIPEEHFDDFKLNDWIKSNFWIITSTLEEVREQLKNNKLGLEFEEIVEEVNIYREGTEYDISVIDVEFDIRNEDNIDIGYELFEGYLIVRDYYHNKLYLIINPMKDDYYYDLLSNTGLD